MKKILGLLMAVLVVSMTATVVFAPSEDDSGNESSKGPVATAVAAKVSATTKAAYKTMLKNYFSPVLHGNGIGFTDDSYIVAKWHMVSVKVLAKNRIREALGSGEDINLTAARERIMNYIETEGTVMHKGRINIGNTNYILTDIVVMDGSATADIREIPDYSACKQANTTAEECDSNSSKVGDMSLTKKTSAIGEEKQNVWAGTLNFMDVAYTFVTFANPR